MHFMIFFYSDAKLPSIATETEKFLQNNAMKKSKLKAKEGHTKVLYVNKH